MNYSMHLLILLATLPASPRSSDDTPEPASPVRPPLADQVAAAVQRLRQLAEDFRQQPLAPLRTHPFEQQLQDELRELGREVVQWTSNQLEPVAVEALAKHVSFEACSYTRLNAQTPQNAWTLFGQIRLWRAGYRPTDQSGDAT